VEAASPLGWDRYVGSRGTRIGMVSFGASAPYKDLYQHFGFTVAHILDAAKQQIEQHKEIHREPADSVA
jgi:transketolase